ncbi:permease-like cell division protein FtsX [Erysipelotrichaceae bacterium OttesenSCG-928-M19]|nr:permease-like cell division protein FtsX [Erysipelotrichaceae bacterium OttesenSCG-928-M19]
MIISKLGRHIKSAFVGIFRNFWMSFSATTAVAVTLLLVSLFTVLSLNVSSFMTSIEQNITIRAMVDDNYDATQIYDEKTKKDPLGDKLRALSGVQTVEFVSKEEEFDRYVKLTGDNASMYERLKDKNPMSNIYKVTLEDGNSDYDAVSKAIEGIEGIKSANYGTGGIHRLVDIFNQMSSVMLFFMATLILLAIFLISNTIKLTIYNRKTEIQIMRLVGASNGYIRFPFILEGIIIGVLGAIIPAVLTVVVYGKILETNENGFFISSALQFASMSEINMVAGLLFAIGAIVGMIGSLISVSRYLKA